MMTVASTPLYLSRLFLNPLSRQVQNELTMPYELHRTLMKAFPQKLSPGVNPRESFNVLFRVDVDSRSGRISLLVQSNEEPNWSWQMGLDNYLLKENGASVTPETKSISAALDVLNAGQQFCFRLRANPTKRLQKDEKNCGANKGKRVGLYKEEEQLDWLRRKASGMGFEIVRLDIAPEGMQKGRKQSIDTCARHALKHHAVRFEGILRIVSRERFHDAIVSGIGAGKAFGFGLLSIAPVRSIDD